MTFNSQSIIHDIRRELDKLINVASGEQAQKATADHVERTLFRGMLPLEKAPAIASITSRGVSNPKFK